MRHAGSWPDNHHNFHDYIVAVDSNALDGLVLDEIAPGVGVDAGGELGTMSDSVAATKFSWLRLPRPVHLILSPCFFFSRGFALAVTSAAAQKLSTANLAPSRTTAAAPQKRRIFVTTALPYAERQVPSGPHDGVHPGGHLGALPAHAGHEVHWMCADDTHGAPIMIAAEKAGKTPQEFVAEIAATRKEYLDGFHLSINNWYSTDSPENVELAQDIYRQAEGVRLIASKTIEQFFDPVKSMFLPDRYIKGECPKCGTKDQYGDSCENCGAVYAPTDLKNPYSTLSGATPEMRSSGAFLLQALRPAMRGLSARNWTEGLDRHDKKRLQKAKSSPRPSEWLGEDGKKQRLGYFARRAVLRHPDPRCTGKYFYVWLDAPVGYLASLKTTSTAVGRRRTAKSRSFAEFLADPDTEQIHFIGKDIVTSTSSSGRRCSSSPATRCRIA